MLAAEYAHAASPPARELNLPTAKQGPAAASPLATLIADDCGATVARNSFWLQVDPGSGALSAGYYFVFRGGRALLWLTYP